MFDFLAICTQVSWIFTEPPTLLLAVRRISTFRIDKCFYAVTALRLGLLLYLAIGERQGNPCFGTNKSIPDMRDSARAQRI